MTTAIIHAAARRVMTTAADIPAVAPVPRPDEDPVATVGREVVQKSLLKPDTAAVQDESTAKSTPSMLTVAEAVVVPMTHVLINPTISVAVREPGANTWALNVTWSDSVASGLHWKRC